MRIEVLPVGAAYPKRGPINCTAINFVSQHLVSVVGHTGRTSVAGNRAAHVRPFRRPDNTRAVRNLDNQDLHIRQLNVGDRRRQRRLRAIRDQRLHT